MDGHGLSLGHNLTERANELIAQATRSSVRPGRPKGFYGIRLALYRQNVASISPLGHTIYHRTIMRRTIMSSTRLMIIAASILALSGCVVAPEPYPAYG